jgi:hypothetical protein
MPGRQNEQTKKSSGKHGNGDYSLAGMIFWRRMFSATGTIQEDV